MVPRTIEHDVLRATAAIVLGSLLVFYAVICLVLFLDVKGVYRTAAREFQGDAVETIVALVESEHYDNAMKNKAIWALGQISDKRALPVLKEFYTGDDHSDPCAPQCTICQYEVAKAMKYCNGSFSVTKWMYRFL